MSNTPLQTAEAALRSARDALSSHNEWHEIYDDLGGYRESDLQERTYAALHEINGALARIASPPETPTCGLPSDRSDDPYAPVAGSPSPPSKEVT